MRGFRRIFGAVLIFGLPSTCYAYNEVEQILFALTGLLVPIVVAIIVFLICREIFCWYWKINATLAVLTEIRDLLKNSNLSSGQIPATNGKSHVPGPIPTTNETEKIGGPGHHWGENDKTHSVVKKCPKCGGVFHGAEFEVCEECNCSLVDPLEDVLNKPFQT